MKKTALLAAALLLAIGLHLPARAADNGEPYGSAHFETFPDINRIKTLKTVWDFNFADPKAVGIVFNNIVALMKATAAYGPVDLHPLRIVVVSHGPEVVVWAKKNYGKYKELVDRAASLAKQGVVFEVCRNAAAAEGFKPEDLDGFLTVIPAGPYAIAYWENKGYGLEAYGATRPTPPIDALNRADLGTRH